MADSERQSHSPEGLSSEMDSFVEQCRSFVRKTKTLYRSPGDADAPREVAESFVDLLTNDEIDGVRKKVLEYWEGTKSRQHMTVEITPKILIQGPELTTQTKEAKISLEDAKSVVATERSVKCYSVEQFIEAELSNIRTRKLSQSYEETAETTPDPKPSAIEPMDSLDFENKADTHTVRQKSIPAMRSTDVLDTLLRIYETYSDENIGIQPSTSENRAPLFKNFRTFLTFEMQIIYERLVSIYPLKFITTVDTSKSSDVISIIPSPSEFSRTDTTTTSGAYPDVTTRTDDTLSSLPLSTMDDTASDLVAEPVADQDTGAQHKTLSKSSNESVSTAEGSTLSGISSIPTDPRASVSSMKDILASRGGSVSSMMDLCLRTSRSSMRDPSKRTSLDIESLMAQPLEDDAFLSVPEETVRYPRRRSLSDGEEKDIRDESKKPTY